MKKEGYLFSKTISLVAGGSSGIGRAAVLALSRRRDYVIYTYQNENSAQETADLVRSEGGCCLPVKYDISDIKASAGLVEQILKQHGHIDCFINCAGISNTKTVREIDENEWDRMMDVNLKGAFFLTKEVFAAMQEKKKGSIVLVTSIAGQRGGRFSGIHYSVSKGGVETMMKCFALQGAESGIRVNAVSPGVADTPMSREEGIGTADIPMGRAASAEEVADAICYLVSEKASYITGTTLDVNGGQMMR